MTAEPNPPKQNTAARIIILGLVVVVGIGLWTAAWAYGRAVVETQLDAQIALMDENGTNVQCSDREIAGYPFRFDVSCSNVVVQNQLGQTIQLGTVRGTALIYNPWHVIVEADGPFAANDLVAGELVSGVWELGQASMRLGDEGPKQIDLVITKPGFKGAPSFGAAEFKAEETSIHVRKAPDAPTDLDLYVSAKAFAGNGLLASLPLLDGVFQIRLPNGAKLLQGATLAGLPRLEDGSLPFNLSTVSLANSESQLALSGDLKLDRSGLLWGELELKIVGLKQLAGLVQSSMPEAASLPDMLRGASQAMGTAEVSENGDEIIRLPISVTGGNARIGFLPIGRIPPIYLSGL